MTKLEHLNREELLDNLWDGKWKSYDINIGTYLANYDFSVLRSIAHGCKLNNSPEMLFMLYILLKAKMEYPDALKITSRKRLEDLIINGGIYPNIYEMSMPELVAYFNSRIIVGSLNVLKEIITSAEAMKFAHPKCHEIIDECSVSKEDDIRLYVACVTNEPSVFLNDLNSRVSKVAFLRSEFALKLKTISEEEKLQLEFLEAGLKSGVIRGYDGLTRNQEDGYISARFESPLFLDSEYTQFDADIFYNIPDKMIKANEINKLIQNGSIHFAIGIKPSYFPEVGKKVLTK